MSYWSHSIGLSNFTRRQIGGPAQWDNEVVIFVVPIFSVFQLAHPIIAFLLLAHPRLSRLISLDHAWSTLWQYDMHDKHDKHDKHDMEP